MKRSQQHSLFEESGEDTRPLADRMRPTSLDEVVGQSHQIGSGKALRSMIEADRTPSMIFWGPPGVGKTTLARVIARHTHASFIDFSAVTSGIKEIREVMKQADAQVSMGRRTIVFVDEIHRFNKAQQDAFLPFVEKGSIILIGATTENPSFEVNNALLSRCKVFVLHGLTEEDLVGLMRRALEDPRGFGGREVRIEEQLLRKSLRYDKDGEEHYNIISALHKSMRNSDPDAAVYWLARMLEGGEDPLYVARRITRFASEDVGLADTNALNVAINAFQAAHFIGMPECSVHLAQAVIYLSLAPKSNSSYVAYEHAKKDALHTLAEPVPLAIRNAPTRLMKDLGYGRGYRLAHYEADKVAADMRCLPDSLAGAEYYRPTEEGNERRFKERLEWLTHLREQARAAAPDASANDDEA